MSVLRLYRLLLIILLAVPCIAGASVMRVTLLGTGTPIPSPERFGQAILIEAGETRLLFDTGRGVMQRLYQLRQPLQDIDKVFFTHLHSDHVTGFADLWLTGWIWQRDVPMQVWGPEGTELMMSGIKTAFEFDINARLKYTELAKSGIQLEVEDIEEGVVYHNDDLKVTAFLVDHGPVKPAYGYRIDFGERSVVISGDTTFSTNLIKYAKGADLLIHEVAAARDSLLEENPRLEKVIAYHTTPEQAARVFLRVKPKQAVLIHPVVHGVSNEDILARIAKRYKGEVMFGQDMLVFDVGEKISSRDFSQYQ